MASKIIPCARFILPLTRAGTVMISMTASMTGRSNTRLEFTPNSVELCGMVQGLSKMEMRLYSVTSAQIVVVNLQKH